MPLSPSQHHDKLQPTKWDQLGEFIRVEFFNQVPVQELPREATVGELRAKICKLLKQGACSRFDVCRSREFDICAGQTPLDDSLRVVDSHVWPMPLNLKWRQKGMGRQPGDPYDVEAVSRDDIVSGDADVALNVVGGSPLERFNAGMRPQFRFEDPARHTVTWQDGRYVPDGTTRTSRFDPPQ